MEEFDRLALRGVESAIETDFSSDADGLTSICWSILSRIGLAACWTPRYLEQRTPPMRAAAKRRSHAELGGGVVPRGGVYGALAGRLTAKCRV